MSTVPYTSNPYITRTIRCSWQIAGKQRVYDFVSHACGDQAAIDEAVRVVVWSKHPTFKAELFKYNLHW
jgi:hypothetical protein